MTSVCLHPLAASASPAVQATWAQAKDILQAVDGLELVSAEPAYNVHVHVVCVPGVGPDVLAKARAGSAVADATLVICPATACSDWLAVVDEAVADTSIGQDLATRTRAVARRARRWTPLAASMVRQVVHDLNVPLNALSMMVGVLCDALPLDEDPELAEDHDTVMDALDDMGFQLTALRRLWMPVTAGVGRDRRMAEATGDGLAGPASVDLSRLLRKLVARRTLAQAVDLDVDDGLRCRGPSKAIESLLWVLLANAKVLKHARGQISVQALDMGTTVLLLVEVPCVPLPPDTPARLATLQGSVKLREDGVVVHPIGLSVAYDAATAVQAELKVVLLPGGDLQMSVRLHQS